MSERGELPEEEWRYREIPMDISKDRIDAVFFYEYARSSSPDFLNAVYAARTMGYTKENFSCVGGDFSWLISVPTPWGNRDGTVSLEQGHEYIIRAGLVAEEHGGKALLIAALASIPEFPKVPWSQVKEKRILQLVSKSPPSVDIIDYSKDLEMPELEQYQSARLVIIDHRFSIKRVLSDIKAYLDEEAQWNASDPNIGQSNFETSSMAVRAEHHFGFRLKIDKRAAVPALGRYKLRQHYDFGFTELSEYLLSRTGSYTDRTALVRESKKVEGILAWFDEGLDPESIQHLVTN